MNRPLLSFLPRSPHGSIIITTRSKRVAVKFVDEQSIIEVHSMDVPSAVALLRKKLNAQDVDESELNDLAEALNCIPLALVQAGAYIFRRAPRYSVSSYLKDFATSHHKQRKLLEFEAGHLHRDYEAKNSIMITWQISFDYIRTMRPSAADLFSLMSFFDRSGIQDDILQGFSWSVSQSSTLDDITQDSQDDPSVASNDEGEAELSDSDECKTFEDDIMMLRDYSLVAIHAHGKTFELHRLVQLAMHEWLRSNKVFEHWKEQFIAQLYRQFPKDFKGFDSHWADCQKMFPHVKAAIHQVPQSKESLLQWANLLHNGASFAVEVGNAADVVPMVLKSGSERRSLLGPDHEKTLGSDELLVRAYMLAGEWEKLGALCDAHLKACIKAFGEEDDRTLRSMTFCGEIYRFQARFRDSQSIYSRVIDICKRKQEYSPRALSAMCGLAMLLGEQGRLEEAGILQTQAVSSARRVFGEENSNTIAMICLAMMYGWQGKFEDAEKLYMQALEASKKMFGGAHTSTTCLMHCLAATYYDLGRYADARPLHAEGLGRLRIAYGDDNPITMKSMDYLSTCYMYLGDFEAAELLQKQAVEIKARVHGDEHPITLLGMEKLVSIYFLQGRLQDAASLELLTLEGRRRALGPEHPETLTSMLELAALYLHQDRYEDAERLLAQTSAIQRNRLGDQHPETVLAMKKLAYVHLSLGKNAEAIELMEHCIDMKTQALGSDHPDTLSSRECLLSWLTEGLSLDT